MNYELSWEDFEKVDMRVGTIISAETFPNARKPAYKLQIDFGDLGIKKSSAQITKFYSPDELTGRQIIAVVNFPVKQIGNFFSECLVLGVYNEEKDVILLQPGMKVTNGMKIG
ncbi:tRNA-binding protein [Pollutibacter soli]|uniref:tRNA-binding protein n=1 Tax=Pollutibacter soli TaxID=3034157 RepID=UPI003013FBB2